ncbi:MAG: hypothetical protein E4H02_09340 [Lentisphaerales bacterium]|nr:MAG: hypothetical protein E4H02_09340 [Lentisphaerales bacterium]
MTKQTWIVGIGLAMVAVIEVMAVGCKDDDNGTPAGGVSGELAGVWTALMGADDPADPDFVIVITIGADNTFSVTEDGVPSDSGTWSVSGNQLTLTGLDGTMVFTYTVSGNSLTFAGVDDSDDTSIVFTRVV